MRKRRYFKGYMFVKLFCPMLQTLPASLIASANCLKQESHLGTGAGFQVRPWDTAAAPASVSLSELDLREGCNPVSLSKCAPLPPLLLARNITVSSSAITFQGCFSYC